MLLNICMYSPFSINSAGTYRLISFSKELINCGHSVSIILPSFDKYTPFNLTIPPQGILIIKPFQLKTNKLAVNMIPYSVSTSFLNLKLNFDVVHILKTTPISCLGYFAKICHNTPIIHDIDDLDHMVMAAEGHSRLSRWVVEKCERIPIKFADQVIVTSSALKDYYVKKGLSQNIITCISNGVSVEDFKIKPDYTLKKRYNLKTKVIIYVGSLNNYNQLTSLLLLMQKIVKYRKDTSCLIVGDGMAKPILQRLVKDLHLDEVVVFSGRVSNYMKINLLKISDLGFACFPELEYLRYASNMKVFEYMAAGLPVIVSPIGDLISYIDYGKAGLILDTKINDASTEILQLLSDNKKIRQLANHAEVFVKRFDWQVLTKKLVKIYTKALENKL